VHHKTLDLGDSLSESIDKGIRDSRYGIVILSNNFFAKNWTRQELNGLQTKLVASGRKVILPVWHNISKEEIYNYSPTLADRVGIPTRKGVNHIADEILAELLGREGLVQYKSRSELPQFGMMLSLAKNTVDMSGLDFRIVVHSFINTIRENLRRGIQITFLLLNPDSNHVEIQGKNVFGGEDLKQSIEKTLMLLCQERNTLSTES
jgi:hypothetical protein